MDGPTRYWALAIALVVLTGCYHHPAHDVVFDAASFAPPPVTCCETYTSGVFADPAAMAPPVITAAVDEIPRREQVPLSLTEARRIALENNKNIAVVGFLPGEAEAIIAAEIGVFDTIGGFEAEAGKLDEQVVSLIESVGSLSPTQQTDFFSPLDMNNIYVQQPLRTGGIVEVGLGTDYQFLDPAGSFVFVNPAWRSALNLSITQPIFQDAGRAVVEAPIRIAQANHQQAVHDFQTVVRTVLRETEEAYWTVYLAKRELDIQNDAFYQAADTFEREEELLNLGEGALPDLAEAETQFEAFRIARAQAQFGYDAAQRNLTRLLGFPVDYSREVVPETAPEVEPVNLDWSMAVVAVQQRPEILAQQATIRAAQTNLFLQENGLAPDIDVGFDYAITGLADRFDDSMDVVGDNDFNNWTLGLSWQRPFGRLVANAAVRQARLALSREMAALDEIELEVMHELHQAYQRLVTAQRVLEMHARRRAAAAQQLEARRELYLQRRATLDLQLEAEQIYAIARLAESAALTEYQQALVEWRFASGTMFNSGVVIEEAVPTPESDEAAPEEAVDPAANDAQAPMPPQIQRVPMP